MAWLRGPLPLETYNWGGVVLIGEDPRSGFHFATFLGDRVDVLLGKKDEWKEYPGSEVQLYDNSLEMPPEH